MDPIDYDDIPANPIPPASQKRAGAWRETVRAAFKRGRENGLPRLRQKCTALRWRRIIALGALVGVVYGVVTHPPVLSVPPGHVGWRMNLWSGNVERFAEGPVLILPGVHELTTLSLKDRVYRRKASFRTLEGQNIGVELRLRYGFDLDRLKERGGFPPEQLDTEILQPIVENVLAKTLANHMTYELASGRWETIQQGIVEAMRERLDKEGIRLKLLSFEPLILPADYLSERDRFYQPGTLSFQTNDGMAVGVDFSARYAFERERLQEMARDLPRNVDADVVLPVIQDVMNKVLAHYTVREIFSDKRQEAQEAASAEIRKRLGKDGIVLKALAIGQISLPNDYLAGMEKMMQAELASKQMKYTLELKEKQVRESALVAEADKARREKQAEAAAQEQVIAAKAQAEAMKHILPFKEKQIRQRQLEAEAEKVAKIQQAQAAAEARRIEAEAEADSRKKLADAEIYRLGQVSKINAEQLMREGEALTKSPLLVQKALAEKLSDKLRVIVVPPGTDGRFFGANLIGATNAPARAIGGE